MFLNFDFVVSCTKVFGGGCTVFRNVVLFNNRSVVDIMKSVVFSKQRAFRNFYIFCIFLRLNFLYSSFLKYLLIHPDVLDGHAVCLFPAKLKIFSEVYLVHFGILVYGFWTETSRYSCHFHLKVIRKNERSLNAFFVA